MSKYTTEVRFICETYAGMTESKGLSDVKSILATSAPKVFDFDFPIFDENYRLPLETKILRHYYTREISEETVGLWKLRLEDKLNLIMPYYNQLYKSELLKFNPLYDVDLIRDHKRENAGENNSTENRTTHVDNTQDSNGTRTDTIHNERDETTDTTNKTTRKGTTNTTVNNVVDGTDNTTRDNSVESTANTTGNATTNDSGKVEKNGTGWNLYSDTPQGGIEGIEHADDDVANLAYLTNATKTTNNETTNTTGNSETNTTNKETTNTTGNETTNRTTKDTTKGSTEGTNDETVDGTGKVTVDGSEDGTVNVTTTNNLTGTTNGTEDITGKNTITSTEDYIEHVRGKQGATSYSKMLTEFRETFLNIDAMVVDEMNDLFFGLW